MEEVGRSNAADFYCVEIIEQPSFWWRASVVVTINW